MTGRWSEMGKRQGSVCPLYVNPCLYIDISIHTLAVEQAELARSSSALATAQEIYDGEMVRKGEEVRSLYVCVYIYIYV